MKVVLLDISGIFYQAFYSLKVEHFRRSDGLPTNAIYGMINIIKRIAKEFNGYELIACCDSSKKENFRLKIDSEYKQNRSQTPEDLCKQFKYLDEVIDSMNILNMKKNGYEADDLIAYMCNRTNIVDLKLDGSVYNIDTDSDPNNDIIIVTSDKDMNQLLEYDNNREENKHRVRRYDPRTKKLITYQDVKEKYNVLPEQFTFYQSLIGDKIDNIKGIKGVGPKTAEKIVNKYTNIENFFADEDNKYKDKFDQVKTNLKLVTLCKNIDYKEIFVKKYGLKNDNFKAFCKKMEFQSFRNL